MIPTGIIFVNDDLTDSTKTAIVNQLFITDVVDGYTFDSIIDGYVDGYLFPSVVKNNNRRVLVIRSFLNEHNRNYADVVIFVSHGMASILKNGFGPPGATYSVSGLTWQKLCIFDMPIYSCKSCGSKSGCCSQNKCCKPIYNSHINYGSSNNCCTGSSSCKCNSCCSPYGKQFTSTRVYKSKRRNCNSC